MYTQEDLELKTVVELRDICREMQISGMSKQRKDIIIDEIITIQESTSTPENVKGQFKTVTKDGELETTIRVSCGASSDKFAVAGKTVGAVSEILREVLNVDRMSTGIVNGEEVDDSYILESGDTLEFIKPTGGKGFKSTDPAAIAAFKQKMKEAHSKPEVREKHKLAAVNSWKDPEKKELRKKAMKEARARKKAAGVASTPDPVAPAA